LDPRSKPRMEAARVIDVARPGFSCSREWRGVVTGARCKGIRPPHGIDILQLGLDEVHAREWPCARYPRNARDRDAGLRPSKRYQAGLVIVRAAVEALTRIIFTPVELD
jgi:hypothetical protein